MTWSSFADGKYRIGIARSPSGKVDGGWIHDPEYVNGDDGGHAMIFKTFDGKTKISYHAPNSKTETLTIRDFAAKDGKFVISRRIIRLTIRRGGVKDCAYKMRRSGCSPREYFYTEKT